MGNQITGGDITPGRSARIEVEEQDGEYSAQRIEVEDEDHEGQGAEVEFGGVVKAVNGNAVTVQASFGTATVLIGPTTEVKGALTPGVTVEVEANAQNDGSYLATQDRGQGRGDGRRRWGRWNDSGAGGGDSEQRPGGDDSGPTAAATPRVAAPTAAAATPPAPATRAGQR